MKPLPQYFALLRYHLFASPWIWVFPLVLGLQPSLMNMTRSGSWGAAEFVSMTPLSMLPMMLAAFIFAGEKLLGGTPGLTPQTYQQIQTFAGEFLFTRAVDRSIVFRARLTVYWTLILLPLLVLVGVMAWRPELTVTVPSKAQDQVQFYLAQLPGASLAETANKGLQKVVSPHGWVSFGMVTALVGAAMAAVWPMIVYVIMPLRFRKWIFWGLLIGIVALPLTQMRHGTGKIGAFEHGALWAMNHLAICAGVVLVLAVVSYLFTAARNRDVEYS